MSFAHLHVHTEFSLLDGSNKIKEYVSRVKELGMNSAAITDHGVMYGVIDFGKPRSRESIQSLDVKCMWLRILVLIARSQEEMTDIIILCFWQKMRKDMRI